MSLLPDLAVMALRPLLCNMLEQVGNYAQQGLTAAPTAALQAVGRFLYTRFTDPSKKLPDALRRSADRAWRSLEVALAGESWLTRWAARGEDKAFRQQVRLILDARALDFPGLDAAFRRRCLDQLRAARKAGLIPGALDPKTAAERTASFAPSAIRQERAKASGASFGRCPAGFAGSDTLTWPTCWSCSRRGTTPPLLAFAVRFFFRREIEADPSLFQGFLYAQVDQLGQAVRAGFERLAEAFAELGSVLEKHGESLEQILDVLYALHGEMNALRGEMNAKLDELLARNHVPPGSQPQYRVSISDEKERQFLLRMRDEYRGLPPDARRGFDLGKLGDALRAAGLPAEAKEAYADAAAQTTDRTEQAAHHYKEYLADLERGRWGDALTAVVKAAALDARFAPFPDRYEAERILGAGGFGVAFLCRHRHSRARLIVKAIHAEALGGGLGEVFNEAAALEELEHPAVIRLRDCGYADAGQTRPYLVMDYFEGPTLEDRVRHKGTLAPVEARAVAVQMAEGLRAAHNRNLFHRDVKPGNVLVRQAADGWQVKLIDFGLALHQQTVKNAVNEADALAKTVRGRSIVGTLDYAAPEQMGKLNAPIGPYSDVYGFGRTLCYAMFGTPHPVRRHWRGLKDEPLSDLLEACIEEQPADRPADFADVLQRLRQAPPTEGPADPPEEPQQLDTAAATEADEEAKMHEQYMRHCYGHPHAAAFHAAMATKYAAPIDGRPQMNEGDEVSRAVRAVHDVLLHRNAVRVRH